MSQKFRASPTDTFTWPNGAIGHRTGGPLDTLGPYAKVRNCPIDGTNEKLTCYATGYADSFFSVPACTSKRKKHVGGFFTITDNNIVFVPHDKYRHLFDIPPGVKQ